MLTIEDEADAYRCVSDGRKRERATKRRTDAKFLRRCATAKGDSNQCNDALWSSRAEGRQDGARSLLADIHLVTNPLHAVHEELA